MSPTQELQPASASTIFLRIGDFARLSVTEQTRQRQQLNSAVAAAVAALPAQGRVVLEAADGAAIVVLNDAAAALDAAARARDAAAGVPLCIGLNHGPVKRDQRDTNAATVIGDGIDAAVSAAWFAASSAAPLAVPGAASAAASAATAPVTPGAAPALLATRAFRDALARQSPQRAATLYPAGAFTDAAMRSHELFHYDPAAARARAQRRTLFGSAGIVAILALGAGGRAWRLAWEEARRPAILTFDIKPQGDIYLDGEFKGTAPPLTRLHVAPGAHTVEIRQGRFKPVLVDLNLGPAQEMAIKHTFVAAPVPQRKPGAPAPERSPVEKALEKFRLWK